MLSRGFKRLNIGRKSPKVTNKNSGVSSELVQAAQALRTHLGAGSSAATSRENAVPVKELVDLAEAMRGSPKIPESVLRLIQRTLNDATNYKGSLSAANLQLLFRAVAKCSTDIGLATKLYMDLYRHSKVSSVERLENGREYYRLLRSKGFFLQADKMLAALLQDNRSALSDEFVLSLGEIAVAESEHSTSEAAATSLMIIMRSAYLSEAPSTNVVSHFVSLMLQTKHVASLEGLTAFIYFENPHFEVADEVAIVFLDAYLQLPTENVASAQKLLHLVLARTNEKTSLEECELLLMACIHFQEPVSLGHRVHSIIRDHYSAQKDFTKETWDTLAQFAVYSSEQPVENLKNTVLTQMPREYIDDATLCATLVAASDKAQCSERQISELANYFRDALDVAPDAKAYSILINRALRAVEVERARQLFVTSNTDWSIDSYKYVGVLSELLVALCRTTSIPRPLVMDTYNRVRLFAPKVSYDAQVAILEMLTQSSGLDAILPLVGQFLVEQFSEQPDLPWEKYKHIFNLLFMKTVTASSSDEVLDWFQLLFPTIHLPYEAYYPLMQKLSSIGRPDAAHLLFRQLRSRAKNEGTRPPGEEIYLMLFAEYAKWKYETGVFELEVYFRVDSNQELSAAMLNKMLAAYSSLDDSNKMAYLWSEFMALPRGGAYGPNNETMCIMLQYFSSRMGMARVEDLWENMGPTFRLTPSKESFKQYVIANCYNGYYSRALELVKRAPEQYDFKIDRDILQSLYNWTMLPSRKQEVKDFAMETYPDEWAALESTDGALKSVILPAEDEVGETDANSVRLAAIRQLEEEEKKSLAVR